MKTIYHYTGDDNTVGEVEGMFDDDFVLLSCWSRDDARWRDEYFDEFMRKIGIAVKRLPKEEENGALRLIRDNMGFGNYN